MICGLSKSDGHFILPLPKNSKWIGVSLIALGIIITLVGTLAFFGTKTTSLLHTSFGAISNHGTSILVILGSACLLVGILCAIRKNHYLIPSDSEKKFKPEECQVYPIRVGGQIVGFAARSIYS